MLNDKPGARRNFRPTWHGFRAATMLPSRKFHKLLGQDAVILYNALPASLLRSGGIPPRPSFMARSCAPDRVRTPRRIA
jgi:hypothetical protein